MKSTSHKFESAIVLIDEIRSGQARILAGTVGTEYGYVRVFSERKRTLLSVIAKGRVWERELDRSFVVEGLVMEAVKFARDVMAAETDRIG